MGIELPESQRRWVKKLQRGRPTLRELYDKLCPVDAGAVGPLGTCTTCGRQIKEPPEPDPVPNGVMVPVDEEKAERLASSTSGSMPSERSVRLQPRPSARRKSNGYRARQCQTIHQRAEIGPLSLMRMGAHAT
jgi:hypothetical protein